MRLNVWQNNENGTREQGRSACAATKVRFTRDRSSHTFRSKHVPNMLIAQNSSCDVIRLTFAEMRLSVFADQPILRQRALCKMPCIGTTGNQRNTGAQ